MYSLYSNNIELIGVNSVTEQEMESFPEEFLESMWTNWKIHTCVYTLIKETLKETPLCLYSEFSGVVHYINPTFYRYILQSRHGHCKGTHLLVFLFKRLENCDNSISLGTGSHIFGPRNEMNFVPCLTEYSLRLCNVSFRRKLFGRETGTNI